MALNGAYIPNAIEWNLPPSAIAWSLPPQCYCMASTSPMPLTGIYLPMPFRGAYLSNIFTWGPPPQFQCLHIVDLPSAITWRFKGFSYWLLGGHVVVNSTHFLSWVSKAMKGVKQVINGRLKVVDFFHQLLSSLLGSCLCVWKKHEAPEVRCSSSGPFR